MRKMGSPIVWQIQQQRRVLPILLLRRVESAQTSQAGEFESEGRRNLASRWCQSKESVLTQPDVESLS